MSGYMSGVLVIGSQPSPLDVSGIVTLSASPECAGAAINMYTLDASNNYTGTVANNQINVGTGATVQVGMFTTALDGTTTYPSTPQVTATFVGPAAVSSVPVITALKYSYIDYSAFYGTVTSIVSASMSSSSDYITVSSITNKYVIQPVTTTTDYTLSMTITDPDNNNVIPNVLVDSNDPTQGVYLPRNQNIKISCTIKNNATNEISSPFVVKYNGGELASLLRYDKFGGVKDYHLNDDRLISQLDTLNLTYSQISNTAQVTTSSSDNFKVIAYYTDSTTKDALVLTAAYTSAITTTGSGDNAQELATYSINNGQSITGSTNSNSGALISAFIYTKNTNIWSDAYVVNGYGDKNKQFVSPYTNLAMSQNSTRNVNGTTQIKTFINNTATNTIGGKTKYFAVDFKYTAPTGYKYAGQQTFSRYHFVINDNSSITTSGKTFKTISVIPLHSSNTKIIYSVQSPPVSNNTTRSAFITNAIVNTTTGITISSEADAIISKIEVLGSISGDKLGKLYTNSSSASATYSINNFMTYIITCKGASGDYMPFIVNEVSPYGSTNGSVYNTPHSLAMAALYKTYLSPLIVPSAFFSVDINLVSIVTTSNPGDNYKSVTVTKLNGVLVTMKIDTNSTFTINPSYIVDTTSENNSNLYPTFLLSS